MELTDIAELAGQLMEAIGVSIIVVGALVATGQFVLQFRHRLSATVMYKAYRVGLARAILLGLEFLVAGDIIRTVAVEPRINSVGVLAAIVGIRTVLSVSLQLEIEGRWPWQAAAAGDANRQPLAPQRSGGDS
jgi:uncharacterized membrane protein